MPHSFKDFPAHVRAAFSRGQDYRTVFGSPAGERVLADLMQFCGAGRDLFVAGAPDQTAYEVGKRRVALRVMNFMRMDERAAARMAEKAQQNDEGDLA